MELIKDFFTILITIFAYYAEAIRYIYSIVIYNRSYLEFFMIYTAYLFPTVFLFNRIVRDSYLNSLKNITVHIYIFVMTMIPLIIDKEIIFFIDGNVSIDGTKPYFIYFLATLYGIQTLSNRVSTIEIAGRRITDYRDSKKVNYSRFYKKTNNKK